MTVHRRWLVPFVCAALVVVGLEGCGGPTFVIQQYAGPQRAKETIAIIRINGKDAIIWVSLDGEAAGARLEQDSRFHIEVLPGKHTLGIAGKADPSTAFVSFEAEAGKVYRPVLESAPVIDPVTGASAARIYEVDAERDTPIRDVTLRRANPDVPERSMAPPPPPAPPKIVSESDAGATEPAAPSDGGTQSSGDAGGGP